MTGSTDRIERSVMLKASRSRVWRALSNAEEFGNWFGVKLEGKAFVAGQRVQGQITYPGYEHLVFDVLIEQVEAERVLSWRWHPAAIDPAVTLLTVVESGFDSVPSRRLEAFRMNSQGWDEQMKNIEKHVANS